MTLSDLCVCVCVCVCVCYWQVDCEKFLERAHQIDAASLSPKDFVTLKVFKEEINTYVQNLPYKK